MDAFLNFIGGIFGYVLMFFNNIFGNFGVAIIAFTIFTRLLMFPLTINQQKTSAKMQRLQPKMKEIQEKYGNDKVKYNEEVQKLYEREGASPAGGCLPLLIQMPIFYGLYRALCMPLTCTLHLNITEGALGTAIARVKSLSDVYTSTTSSYYSQINVIEAVRNIVENGGYAKYGFTPAEVNALQPIEEVSRNFNFLGIDLLSMAEFWNPALILTVVVFVASAGGMYLSNKLTGMNTQSMQGCSPNMMGVMMGLMSAWISFSVPSAMALYWSCTSLIAPFQTVIVQKFYNAAILNAKAEAQRAAKIKLEESEIIRSVNATKGAREFAPVYTMPAVDESKPAAEKKKSSGKKKKSGSANGSKKNSSADYQGKKKK